MSDNELYLISKGLPDDHKKVLIHLYHDYSNMVDSFAEQIPVLATLPDNDAITETLCLLEEMELVDLTGSSFRLFPTPIALRIVEEILLPDAPEVTRNQKIRGEFLLELALKREQHGARSGWRIEEIGDPSVNPYEKNAPLNHLMALGFVTDDQSTCFRITSRGYEVAKRIRQQNSFFEEYLSIAKMSPGKRGIEFQKFVCRLLEFQGWNQDEGIRTSTEEIDVVVHRGLEYFLLECKWEQAPVGAPVVREFFAKLFKRSQSKGVIVSKSGFAETARSEAVDFFGHRPILLLGGVDIEDLVSFKRSFDEIVAERFDRLMKKRESIFR